MSLRVNPDRLRVQRRSQAPLHPFPYAGLRRAWRPPQFSVLHSVTSGTIAVRDGMGWCGGMKKTPSGSGLDQELQSLGWEEARKG